MDPELIAEMRFRLEQECKKPVEMRDYALISELTDAIYHAMSEDDIGEITKNGLIKLNARREKYEKHLRKMRWSKAAGAIAACAVLAFGLNAWTMRVWGMNPLQVLYEIIPGGIQMNPTEFEPEKEIQLSVSEDDPYGIRTKCEEYGFSPLTPSYIPEDMKLVDLSGIDEKNYKHLSFTFKTGEKYVGIDYDYILDQEMYNNTTIGLPSDKYNIYTEEIEGRTVLISWEDQILRVKFCDEFVVYGLSCKKIDYNTAYRILLSYFE
jgi:hypothetical protein